MKRYLLAVLLAASLAFIPVRAALSDAPAPTGAPASTSAAPTPAAQTATAPTPDDQPAGVPSEFIPAAASTAPAARAARGGAAAPFTHNLTADELAQLHAKLDELNTAIKALKDAKADDDLVVDAESCSWVIETTLRVPNVFGGDTAELANPFNKCISILNAGLRRAQQIKDGTATWPQLKGTVKRAYRSVVDGTPQPYELIIPASYDPAKPIALYVYLHGMSHYVPDLDWASVGGNDRPGGGGGNYIRVNIVGRGNNSFRWAGETDVLEALASIRKRYNIDPNRIVLAGFSMGGAGSWQIGLHQPDLFCGLEIDAGVIGNRLNMDNLTPAQKGAQATYGIMIPHAVNLVDIPIVAYAGSNDMQLASSKSISAELVRQGYHMATVSQYYSVGTDIFTVWLACPGQGHDHAKHDNVQDTLKLVTDFTNANFERGRVIPDHIRYVTYTLRYNHDFWLTVDGMQQQFEQAQVDATRDAAKANYTIKTQNISRLVLDDMAQAKQITIDGDALAVKPAASLLLTRTAAGHWQQGDAATNRSDDLRKQHDLQGPVNDAFFDAFLCVTPTGTPFNAIADERGKQELARFSAMFTIQYCGDARTKADTDITDADIANNNLVLFGDPGSNKILAKIAGQLPIKWTKDNITVGDKTYSAADHVPVLIYPNPLNPKRYIVLNTGLVAGGGGGGNNAQGYGDFAILQVTKNADGHIADKVAQDGLFDESWKLARSP